MDALIGGDKLILRGLTFFGFHGAIKEENTLGQKFVVDIDAWMDLKPAGISDNLSHTFSYAEIYRSVQQIHPFIIILMEFIHQILKIDLL